MDVEDAIQNVLVAVVAVMVVVQDVTRLVVDVRHHALLLVDQDALVGVPDVQVLVQLVVLDVVGVHQAVQIIVRLIVERDVLDNAMDLQHHLYIVIDIKE